MSENTTTTTVGTEESRALPCFVRHEDAGGHCGRIATMKVYGINFCEAHGEEAKLGAGLEQYDGNLAKNPGFCRSLGETVRPLLDRHPSGLQAASILALSSSKPARP